VGLVALGAGRVGRRLPVVGVAGVAAASLPDVAGVGWGGGGASSSQVTSRCSPLTAPSQPSTITVYGTPAAATKSTCSSAPSGLEDAPTHPVPSHATESVTNRSRSADNPVIDSVTGPPDPSSSDHTCSGPLYVKSTQP
jgi:hypothetical protein